MTLLGEVPDAGGERDGAAIPRVLRIGARFDQRRQSVHVIHPLELHTRIQQHAEEIGSERGIARQGEGVIEIRECKGGGS